MTAGDYTVLLKIGAWSATIKRRDVTNQAADAITMEPLNVAWSMTDRYPSQPAPTTASFGLFVPNILTGPTPVQGLRVEITIKTPDHNAAAVNIEPVLDFVGLITQVEATTLRDGLSYQITAADYTSTLGEERIGDSDWFEEDRYNRLARIVDASPLLTIDSALAAEISSYPGLGVEVGPREANTATTRSVLDEIAPMMHWMGTVPPWFQYGFDGGSGDPFFAPPDLVSWMMPMVGQSVDGAGVVSLPITALPGGGPDITESLPYNLTMVNGVATLSRKNITPADSRVCWIPAAAVDSKAVTWRQDKASNVNRIRASGTEFSMYGQLGANLLEGFADLIAAYGPNEMGLDLSDARYHLATSSITLIRAQTTLAEVMLWALIGTYYDASPRWGLDQVTIRAEAIPNGDQWPRLFSPRAHTRTFDQAAGKLVLITDIAKRWNLHGRNDYFGRLSGATLTLAGGRISWTADLAHRLPVGSGLEGYTIGTPVHSPTTYAEVAAGANPTYAQCGNLTAADLELVE